MSFGNGFGTVLGSQEPGFSHLFRKIFEANFEVRIGGSKNRVLRPKNNFAARFSDGPAECAWPGGEIERR